MGATSLFAFRTYSDSAAEGTAPFNLYADFRTDWYWLSYEGTTDLQQYYANLLIIQYLDKPRAYAMIQSLVRTVIMEALPLQVQDAFNIFGDNTAVGNQLDVLGKYVGVTRSGYGFFGPITLEDDDFLTLIQMGIARNRAGSSLATIQELLYQFFAGEVYVFDYANMYMSYLINESIGSQDLINLFVTEGLLPKPMGVGISVIAAPVIDMFFGLRSYLAPASPLTTPLNSYGDYQTSWLFLTYADAIVA